jgi:MFS family permease
VKSFLVLESLEGYLMALNDVVRNVSLLSMCQALAQTQMVLIFSVTTFIGAALAPVVNFFGVPFSLATLPITVQFTFMTLSTLPAALLMKKLGRANGFILFILLGVLGIAVCLIALVYHDFILFCIGSSLFGASAGSNQQFRFAAVDTADEATRSKAVSLVLAGGVFAGIVGPTLSAWSFDLLAPVIYAGVFAVIMAMQIIMVILLLFTNIPPPNKTELSGPTRSFWEIASQPKFIVAVMSAMVGYGVMNFVMLATPLFMGSHPAHSFTFPDVNDVIMWHVLGMFAPSFFTGWLIKRYGDINIITIGAIISGISIAVNLTGDTLMHLRIAMALVGLGWNFMFTGGTTLLLQTYKPSEKAKVQGINDFFVFGTVAVCSLLAGGTYQSVGWSAVNLAAVPLLVLVLVSVIWLRGRRLPVTT